MKRFTASLAALFLLPSCASIFNRTNQPVKVESTPAGLSFEIKDRDDKVVQTGTTPATVTLSTRYGYFKGQTYTITARKGGKVIATKTLNSEITPWYFGNILVGGLLGMVVIDPSSGAMWTLPDSVNLSSGVLAMATPVGSVKVIALSDLPASQHSKLVRI